MEFLDFKDLYNNLSKRYLEISKYLNLEEVKKNLEKLKNLTLKEDFWSHKDKATSILKQISRIEYDLKFYAKIEDSFENLNVSNELAELTENIDIESIEIIKSFQKLIDDLEVKKTLNGKDDFRDAIIQIHPGAGGIESQDWASMLFRMFNKWTKIKYLAKNIS